jgi:hypothetical protein
MRHEILPFQIRFIAVTTTGLAERTPVPCDPFVINHMKAVLNEMTLPAIRLR